MTREEAIEFVKEAFIAWESEYRLPHEDWTETHKARDMAIEALSANGDLIRRADAIEAVKETILKRFNLADWYEEMLNCGVEIEDRINALPSADAVSREEYEDIIKDYRKQYENMNNEIADVEAKLADAVKVAYICDGRKCDKDCSECFRTLDIEHARDFKRMGGTYYQQESADAVPTVIRTKTFMRKEDFDKWAEDIKRQNKSIVCIPADAEVVSADAVQGEWVEHKDCEGKTRTIMCSRCGYQERSWVNMNFCPNCGARMKGGAE